MRIAPPTLDTAPEGARPLFAALKQKLGAVPNLFATIGHSPAALTALLGAMESLEHGRLAPREVEAVNLATSELNGCGYCISAHATLARQLGLSPDEIAARRAGRGSTAREQVLLDLVRRVVRTGGAGAGTELAAAREAGLSDGEVIEALAHVALKTFTNAVAIVAGTEIDFPRAPKLPSP